MRRRTPRTTQHRSLRGTLKRTAATAVFVLTAGLLSPAGGASAAEPPPAPDYCAGRCADILPPGANGSATLAEILSHRVFGTQPAHADDQLGPYDALSAGYPSLTVLQRLLLRGPRWSGRFRHAPPRRCDDHP
jgi:hypothetical protein